MVPQVRHVIGRTLAIGVGGMAGWQYAGRAQQSLPLSPGLVGARGEASLAARFTTLAAWCYPLSVALIRFIIG